MAVLAIVWLVGSVGKSLTAVEVRALRREEAGLDVAVVTVGIAHAAEGVVVSAFASTLLIDVGPSRRSSLVTSDVLDSPGFEVREVISDDFSGANGVDVVDGIGCGFTVLLGEIPVSVGDVAGGADNTEEDLTSVLSDGSSVGSSRASQVGPVRVGDEGDEAFAARGDCTKSDEVGASASESRVDFTGSSSVVTIGFVPLESLEKFGA